MESLAGKKVLFAITKSNWGGAQAYVYTLAKGFRDAGADVAVALGGEGDKDAPPGILAQRLKEADIRVIMVAAFARDISLAEEFKAYGELVEILRAEKPDALYLSSSKAGGLGAFAGRMLRVPKIIFTSHGLPYDEDRAPIARGAIWLLTWLTFLLSHTVIVLSTDNFRRAKELPFCERKIRLIPNGVPEIAFHTKMESRKLLLEKINAAPKAKDVWIGTIAEITKNKGLEYLLEAVAILAAHSLDFFLVVIGGGDRSELEKTARAYGLESRVLFAGYVENASTLLPAFDIFALASIKEGLPYVLLEAGSAGIPVVATRISGATDIIEPKKSGLLVTPKDPSALADALQELIRNAPLRKAYGKALEMSVGENFSEKRMIEDTAALL